TVSRIHRANSQHVVDYSPYNFMIASWESLILIQNSGSNQSPDASVVIGFARLANRDRDSRTWTDFLFQFANQNEENMAPLRNASDDEVQRILKVGTRLKAKTDVYLRRGFPLKSPAGLIFSAPIGQIDMGTEVTVKEVNIFTTNRGLSQI